VKAGVWCAVSAGRNAPVFLTKQLIVKKYLCVERMAFPTPSVVCEL
jgi:hypothetical protein